jgi:hypothetical protein
MKTAAVANDFEHKIQKPTKAPEKNKWKKILLSCKCASVAVILMFLDSMVAPLFGAKSFCWIAFVTWTAFINSSKAEKIEAFMGYIIGYLCTNVMVLISGHLENLMHLNLITLPFGILVSTFTINFFISFYGGKHKIIRSVSGIFLGLTITFAAMDIGFKPSDPKFLLILLIYCIIGLMCEVLRFYIISRAQREQ